MKATPSEKTACFPGNKQFPEMRQLLSCVLLMTLFFLCAASAMAFDHSHRLFSAELHKYVGASGVCYSRWKLKPQNLQRYLDSLANLSAEEFESFSPAQKKALWLNAYNAIALKFVLDRYPIEGKDPRYPPDSIRQIPDTWNVISGKVAGKEVTLYKIAHDILRRDRDCRTHFAITPCAKGGGALQSIAFQSENLDSALDSITRNFMQRPEAMNCNTETGTITVSHIFRWFPLDFLNCYGDGKIPMPPPRDDEIVWNYVQEFLPNETREKLKNKEVKVVYAQYDWALNDAHDNAAKK